VITLSLDIQGVSKVLMRLNSVAEATEELSFFGQATVAKSAVRAIRDRTSKGLDQHERPFLPYKSDRHKRDRAARGLPAMVNMKFSGGMLGAMRATRRGVPSQPAIRFNSAFAGYIADLHQSGTGGMPTRKFLGLERGTSSYAEVKATAVEALRRQIRNAIRRP